MQRTGWVLSALFGLFMLVASVWPKLSGMAVARESMAGLGWPDAPVFLIGCLELLGTVLFLIPATGPLGAVLLMGIFGGAIATQMQAGSPLVSHVLFSVYLGVLMWAGLWLRDPALRRVLPLRR